MTPFDWVKQITVEKREWNSFTEEEQSNFNPFIINKALSFNKDYIQVVEMAMVYPMPPQKLYEFYRDVIPKKPIWSKWVKGQVNFDEEELKFISEYFECSQRESKDIVKTFQEMKFRTWVVSRIAPTCEDDFNKLNQFVKGLKQKIINFYPRSLF